jgi:hypothetical protein
MDCLTLRQSLLRGSAVVRSLVRAPEFAVVVELAVEERVPPPRLEERAEITLSVLRPTGFLLLLRSREITCSWGLPSC